MKYINDKALPDMTIAALFELASTTQQKLLQVESAMDSLLRAVEIAAFTRQFDTNSPWFKEAMATLSDRLEQPMEDTNSEEIHTRVLEGQITEDQFAKITETLSGEVLDKPSVVADMHSKIGEDAYRISKEKRNKPLSDMK